MYNNIEILSNVFVDYRYVIMWLVLTIFAFIIEGNTGDLSSLWFAVGSLVAMFIATVYPEALLLQSIVFALSSTLLFIFIRPIVKRWTKVNEYKTNADSLIGKIGKITRQIEEFGKGEVFIEGKYWTAITTDNSGVDAESRVEILAIQGNKLVVKHTK